jgi:hypothetical protein
MRILRLILFVGVVLSGRNAFATACNLSSGASESTIQAAATAASTNSCTGTASGSQVTLAAGTYAWPTKWNMPCGTTSWTITGPTVGPALLTIGGYLYYLMTPTATINGSITGDVGFSYPAGCTTGFTLQYFEWNGGRPSGGGGGFGYSGYGSGNYNLQYLYVHGFQGQLYSAPGQSMVFWFQDGNSAVQTGNPATAAVSSNVVVQWNRIGAIDAGDCSVFMNEYQYVPDNTSGSSYGSAGGYCGTLGIHSYTTNWNVHNNNWFHIEQGGKCYTAGGGSPYYTYLENNFIFQYNDISQHHRIGFEGQCDASPTESFDSNSIHDYYYPGYGGWALSLPQSGGAPGTASPGTTNLTNNLIIGSTAVPNVPATSANCYQYASGVTSCYSGSSTGGYYYTPALEAWGPGTASHNLAQGYPGALAAPGCTTSAGTVNYNIAQLFSGSYVTGVEQCSGAPPPTQTGNQFGTTVSTRQSVAPVITPTATGTYSAPVTVTITSNGYTGSTTPGPLGNTSAYYTTDGSTPTTSSTFCGYSCTFSVAAGTTVNAIAMWGAQNQPKSYASGYGFTPSTVATQVYKSSGVAPTLTGVALTLTGGVTSIQAGNSVQAIATCSYTGGITTNCTSTDAYGNVANTWTSSIPATASITVSGNVAGLAAGTTNLTVKAGSFTSTSLSLTVTAAAPVLQSVAITCTNSIAVGQAGTCSCTGTFTGPTTGSCPSPSYVSGTSSVATVNSSSGALLGIAAGSTVITGTAGGFSNNSTVTVTSNTPPAATLTSLTVACAPASVNVGSTVNCPATCIYSDGSQTSCSTPDAHGSDAAFTSSAPSIATISSSGVATGVAAGNTNISASVGSISSSSFSLAVTPVPTSTVLGQNQFSIGGITYPNNSNANYAVIPAGTTSTVTSCSFYLPTGYTYTAGSKWDCMLTAAPTSTTQAASTLCQYTYTTAGTSADVGWHTGSLTGCGTLGSASVAKAYWIGVNTNESGPIGAGTYGCGSSTTTGNCTGGVPTSNVGTNKCSYLSQNYGSYVGNGTSMTAGCSNTTSQLAAYVTLTTPTPTLVGGYLTSPGQSSSLQYGRTIQFYGACTYSDGTSYLCFPTPDQYGDTLSSITSSVPGVASVGAVGSAQPGLVQGLTIGSTVISAILTGGAKPTNSYGLTVTTNAVPLPPVSPRALIR